MKKQRIFLLMASLLGFVIISCQENEPVNQLDQVPVLPKQVFNYNTSGDLPADFQMELSAKAITVPEHTSADEIQADVIRTNDNQVALNIDDHVATLGRVLFYDTRLSLNNTISCGSCHLQQSAFADPNPISVGFKGKTTSRNSMSIVNPVMNNNMFWDSRLPSVRDLVLEPVRNHIEMGMEEMDKLEQKLADVDFYQPLFEEAFGDQRVTEERIGQALTQFLNSMVSFDSKFDQGKHNNFSNLSPKETLGKDLFFSNKTKCSSCHAGANFSAPDGRFTAEMINSPNINGLSSDLSFDPNPEIIDEFGFMGSEYGGEVKGTANIGLDVVYEDNGKEDGQFKIPSLRNIELTGPYMHDGRFASLEEVVEHYNSGIQDHHNLDKKFKGDDGLPQRLGLNDTEKDALVAFLKTLTDVSFVTDEKFSDPFK